MTEARYTNGAFVRVSDGNRKLSQYEVHMMLSGRGQPKDDETAVPKTALEEPLTMSGPRLSFAFTWTSERTFCKAPRERILRTIKVPVPIHNRYVCSIAGLLALGKYPQQFCPALGLTFVYILAPLSASPECAKNAFWITRGLTEPYRTCWRRRFAFCG